MCPFSLSLPKEMFQYLPSQENVHLHQYQPAQVLIPYRYDAPLIGLDKCNKKMSG